MSNVRSELEKSNWVTGIILNLLGSFSINFGTNLIQYSHFLTAQYKQAAASSIKPSLIFYIGWLIFVAGNLLNFLSFSYATQTILSSLGSVQFIANIVFIYFLFKIYPTKNQLLGTISIIAGNITIVLVANKATFKFDSTQLINLFIRIQYISYLITVIVLSILLQSLYFYLISDLQPAEMKGSKHVDSLLSNSESMESQSVPLRLHRFLFSESELLIPTLYAFVSAMIGTQSVVLAKSSSFLITESVESDSQFNDPITYCFIVAWCVAMMFWLYRMNSALRKYEGVFIIPVLQVLWMLFSILSGGILFKEFDGYYWHNYIVFILATCVIFYGVYQLSPAKDTTADNDPLKSATDISQNETTNMELQPCVPQQIEEEEELHVMDIDANKVKENMHALAEDNELIITHQIHDAPLSVAPETLATNSISLRSLQKIIMKVAGTDGGICLHLAGPSLSYDAHLPQMFASNSNTDPQITQSLPTKLPSDLKDALRKIKLDAVCLTEHETIQKASSCESV